MYASYTLHALEFCTYLPLTSWDILERSECVHHKTADEFAKANRTGTVQLYVKVLYHVWATRDARMRHGLPARTYCSRELFPIPVT